MVKGRSAYLTLQLYFKFNVSCHNLAMGCYTQTQPVGAVESGKNLPLGRRWRSRRTQKIMRESCFLQMRLENKGWTDRSITSEQICNNFCCYFKYAFKTSAALRLWRCRACGRRPRQSSSVSPAECLALGCCGTRKNLVNKAWTRSPGCPWRSLTSKQQSKTGADIICHQGFPAGEL